MSQGEQHGTKYDDDSDFDQGGPVLQVGAFAGAPDVDGGDDGDHGDGDRGGFEGSERDDFGEIAGEGAGERGYGATGNHQEQAPAIEKGRHAAKAITNEDVEAAGFGVGGSELGVGERAEEGEDAADHPDEKGEADGAVELAKDQAGSEEDARADDRADEEEEEIAFAEGAEEGGHSRGIITGGLGASRSLVPAALESTGARMLLAAWGAVEVLRLSSSDSLRMTPRLLVALSIQRTAKIHRMQNAHAMAQSWLCHFSGR